MTTRVQRDWKVTTGYRVLLRVGWGVMGLAVYFAAAAAVLDSTSVWWAVAALAAGALGLVSNLPEPVPRDQLVERRSAVDPRRIR
jgi:hypothetical protein